MKNLAIIPARGGSKRIPRKNIKLFMGKPIIAYFIEAALRSGLFDEVMVSTDDEEIAVVAREYGASVPFMRSAETANDYATTADVICEVLDCYENIGKIFDTVCCIYSTAPFISKDILQQSFHELMVNGWDSIFSLVAFSYPIQRCLYLNSDNYVRMKWSEYVNSRSQDLETMYHDAGQFYISTVTAFLKYNGFWGEKTGAFIMNELQVQDLDTDTDWKLAEMKFQLLRCHEQENNI